MPPSYRYERLSAQDNSFLLGETETAHMHIGGVSIFELGDLTFVWDPEKHRTNVEKHGITFEEAAMTWLEDALSNGPQRAKHIKTWARENCIAERTLERAKDRLGVRSSNEGVPGNNAWFWTLPKGGSP